MFAVEYRQLECHSWWELMKDGELIAYGYNRDALEQIAYALNTVGCRVGLPYCS